MIYLISGQPGTGKSTIAVEHAINRYLVKGRRVVANFPIDVAPICESPRSKLSAASVYVLPDRPGRADLDRIGFGCTTEREEDFGLLIVDEAGIWLSARSWNGSQREEIIDWLSQSRKRGWDVIIIAQGPEMIDKQVRTSICEGVARLRRLDRIKILGVSLPRVHFATVRLGVDQNAPVVERWVYRGGMAHRCFGSYRLFGVDRTHYMVPPAAVSKWPYVQHWSWVWRRRWAFLRFMFGGPVPLGFRVDTFGKLVPDIGLAARGGRPPVVRRGPQLLPTVAAVRSAFMQSGVAVGGSGRP